MPTDELLTIGSEPSKIGSFDIFTIINDFKVELTIINDSLGFNKARLLNGFRVGLDLVIIHLGLLRGGNLFFVGLGLCLMLFVGRVEAIIRVK